MWGYPYWAACMGRGEFFLSRWWVFSLTLVSFFSHRAHRVHWAFRRRFRSHRTPSAYREHRGLTPSPSPNGEGSSMWGYPYWAANMVLGLFFLSLRVVFSLTERTEFTEVFGAHFEPTEGLRHTEVTEAFQLRLAVTFCEIGWLNVSVECCVFCSSVFFCEK